jgi:glycogen operon protein
MPMILMGDEARRTQAGNNNNYCHDDKANWFDWTLVEKHAEVLRFVKLLNSRRTLRSGDAERERKTLYQFVREAHKAWHGVKLFQPDWNDWSHSIALAAELKSEHLLIHIIMNAYWEPLTFELPGTSDSEHGPWRRWIDTALESPSDIVEWQTSPAISESTYRAEARSVVVLFRKVEGSTQV